MERRRRAAIFPLPVPRGPPSEGVNREQATRRVVYPPGPTPSPSRAPTGYTITAHLELTSKILVAIIPVGLVVRRRRVPAPMGPGTGKISHPRLSRDGASQIFGAKGRAASSPIGHRRTPKFGARDSPLAKKSPPNYKSSPRTTITSPDGTLRKNLI